MNLKTLEALLIDRSLGELSPEAEELLDAWVAEHGEASEEEIRITEALAITEQAIAARPELFREEPSTETTPHRPTNAPLLRTWVRAAAGIAALILVGATGFLLGTRSEKSGAPLARASQNETQAPETLLASETTISPWARYRLSTSNDGDLAIEAATPSPSPEETE